MVLCLAAAACGGDPFVTAAADAGSAGDAVVLEGEQPFVSGLDAGEEVLVDAAGDELEHHQVDAGADVGRDAEAHAVDAGADVLRDVAGDELELHDAGVFPDALQDAGPCVPAGCPSCSTGAACCTAAGACGCYRIALVCQ